MKKVGIFLSVVIVLSALVTGCGILGLDDTGVLVLSLSPNLKAKTIAPELDMEVAFYNVTGSGPAGESFVQEGVGGESGGTVVQASLIPGEWNILVEAYNGDEPATKIGEGSISIIVVSGSVTTASVTVVPLSGTGGLALNVTWPVGVLTNAVVTGTLVPSGVTLDPAVHTISFTGGPVSAEYQNTSLATGYYTLSLALLDYGTIQVWGTVEAVRIVYDQTAEKTFTLVEDVNRGGLDLSINPEMDNTILVSFNQSDGVQVGEGENLVVTASTAPEEVDTFAWYLAGELVREGPGGSEDTINLADLGGGYYWLSVVVTKGDVLSSAILKFSVLGEALPPDDPDPGVDVVNVGAPDESGSPSWFERSTLVVVNAARSEPLAYRNLFLPDHPTIMNTFDPVPPLQWNVALGDVALAHSEDMAFTGILAHESSDGTPTFTRIANAVPGLGPMAEVISATPDSWGPMEVVNLWLIDNDYVDADYHSAHRQILLGRSTSGTLLNHTIYGFGRAGGSTFTYNTADFGGGTAYQPDDQRITATHLFEGDDTRFLLTYHDNGGADPARVTLHLDGSEHAMVLMLGTGANGTYSFSLPQSAVTRRYYFLVDDGKGTTWRYPGPGVFQTVGEGTGSENYLAP